MKILSILCFIPAIVLLLLCLGVLIWEWITLRPSWKKKDDLVGIGLFTAFFILPLIGCYLYIAVK